MKKIIIPIVLVLLSLISVNAQWNPFPISGKIYADNPDGLNVRVTNIRSGVIMTTTANGAGEYLIDWANSPGSLKYNITDVFKVEILDCISDSKCTQTITYTGQPELFMTFDLFDISIITTTSTTTTTISSCDSCCPYISCSSCCSDCPIITTTTCPSCPSCPVCPTCPDCPKIDYTWLYTGGAVIILGIIATAVGAYKGKAQIRYYKKYFDPIVNKWKYKWVILFSRAD